jgi:FkbM family methyltransferase
MTDKIVHSTCRKQVLGSYYSQNFEDKALSYIFPGKVGCCVEVGAHDGIYLSNTYHFEQLGWRCILVEPNRESCKKIREVRNAVVFECAASDQIGQAWFCAGNGRDAVYSGLESTSVIVCPSGITSYLVTRRSLDTVLEEAKVTSIDFVTIDVEGHEAAVLRGFTLDRWKPLIVLIEDNNDLADPTIERHMSEAGYFRFYRTGVNDWYAKNGLGRVRLLTKIASAGVFSLKGFVKGALPRTIVRRVLVAKRTLLKGSS